jgi:hypothetical protein
LVTTRSRSPSACRERRFTSRCGRTRSSRSRCSCTTFRRARAPRPQPKSTLA